MFIILPVLAEVSYLYSGSLTEFSTVWLKILKIYYFIFKNQNDNFVDKNLCFKLFFFF